MALPSSSPPFLPIDSSPPVRSSKLPPKRKRQLLELENLSSDPLFSEESSEPEDQSRYDQPRRKRMVQGPWWKAGRQSANFIKSRETATEQEKFRNVDSGVFLGSESSDVSEESVDSLLGSNQRLGQLELNRPYQSISKTPVSHTKPLVDQIIEVTIDAGRETFDLSELGLTSISSKTIEPLGQVIRQAHLDLTEPPSEDEFSSLTPDIQLFLSGNRLSSLPSTLFRLDNLTVLSLRKNELSELPPSIGQLTRLEELNIAGNKIRWLPWELLRFIGRRDPTTRKHFTLRPNPLIEPTKIAGLSAIASVRSHRFADEPLDVETHLELLRRACLAEGHPDLRTDLELRLKLGRSLQSQYLRELTCTGREVQVCREELIYLVSSTVRYFDIAGIPCQKLAPADELFPAVIERAPPPPPAKSTSSLSAPSLFELALQSVQRVYDLSDLPAGLPETVHAALQSAADFIEKPKQNCSTCQREFIIARAEWVEYWFNGFSIQPELTQDSVLPFMRKACSWQCAQPTKPGTFRY